MGQPGNSLLNHLGVSIYWNKPAVSLNKAAISNNILLLFKRFIQILFKFNHVFSSHLFYNKFFFNNKKLLSLPVYISEEMFFKFYRIETLTNLKLGIKKNYLIRLGLTNIYFFSLKFFFINNFLLIYFGFFKPQKYSISATKTPLVSSGGGSVSIPTPDLPSLVLNLYSVLS